MYAKFDASKLDPNRAFWNPEAETMSRDKLRTVQLARLKKELKYMYDNSIFYKRQFDSVRMKPEDVKTFEDFANLPTMDKDIQRKLQDESKERFGYPWGMIACAPNNKLVRTSSTSGTTGTPTLYTLTLNDVNLVRELHARKMWRLGIRPGDVVMHAFALSMFTGGVPVVDGIQEFGAIAIPVGVEGGLTRVLQYWDLCKPNYMVSTPSLAEHMVRRCPEVLGYPADKLGMIGLMCGGEPGAEIPEVRKRTMEGYNLKWYSNYIGGSHNFHGYTCDADKIEVTRGMHLVSEDYCVLELLDTETKKPVELKDGAVGEMCYTYVAWEGSPLLRYRLGDVLEVFTTACECGDPSLRFKIKGRADDMMIIKGVNLYPAALKNFIAGFLPRVTGEFRIFLNAPLPRIVPPLKLQIEYGEGVTKEVLPDLSREIKEKAKNVLRVNPDIEFVAPNTFERTTHKTKYFIKRYEEKS